MTEREKIYLKYKGRCSYCGRKIKYKAMQVDHLYPQRLSGLAVTKGINVNSFENKMPACKRCNHYKRGNNLESFRKLMITLHERIQNIYINKVGIDYGIITIEPFDGKFYFEK